MAFFFFLLVLGLRGYSLNELILKQRLKPGQVYTHKNWQIMTMVTSHSISKDVNNVQYAGAGLK